MPGPGSLSEEDRRPWLEIPVPDYIPLEESEKLNPDKKKNWEIWEDPEEEERVIIIQL